jgi:uroporphyrin-III C-methyltransferase / precorrin-2 dehydrogenase / sirohydrochlorin ferrochelatase
MGFPAFGPHVDALRHQFTSSARQRSPGGQTFRAFSRFRRRHIALFPVYLKLHGRRVVVVGGGPVAASKLAALQAAGADLVVVAPEVCEAITGAGVTIERRPFEPADLDGAWFVVAAAPPAVNRHVSEEAESRHVFVNAVDDPPNASVYLGGVVRRAGVTVGISTEGTAPALAGLLREAIDAMLPADLDVWMQRAHELRRSWRDRQVPMADRRPELLDALNALYADRDSRGARTAAPHGVLPRVQQLETVK